MNKAFKRTLSKPNFCTSCGNSVVLNMGQSTVIASNATLEVSFDTDKDHEDMIWHPIGGVTTKTLEIKGE